MFLIWTFGWKWFHFYTAQGDWWTSFFSFPRTWFSPFGSNWLIIYASWHENEWSSVVASIGFFQVIPQGFYCVLDGAVAVAEVIKRKMFGSDLGPQHFVAYYTLTARAHITESIKKNVGYCTWYLYGLLNLINRSLSCWIWIKYSIGVCCASQPKIHVGILIFENRKVKALNNLTLSKFAMCWAMLLFLFGFSKRFLKCPQQSRSVKMITKSELLCICMMCIIRVGRLNISTIIQILHG
jgi:hypothetical protein